MQVTLAALLVDVWLEAGREGRVFTYRADPDLRLQPGDLVRVPLRNRMMHGLVVGCPMQTIPADRQTLLQPVVALLQRSAVPREWRQWLDGSMVTILPPILELLNGTGDPRNCQ